MKQVEKIVVGDYVRLHAGGVVGVIYQVEAVAASEKDYYGRERPSKLRLLPKFDFMNAGRRRRIMYEYENCIIKVDLLALSAEVGRFRTFIEDVIKENS